MFSGTKGRYSIFYTNGGCGTVSTEFSGTYKNVPETKQRSAPAVFCFVPLVLYIDFILQ